MAITASDARRRLVSLIGEVNDDQRAVEIVSKTTTAFLVPSDEYRSLRETVYLLRSPRNAERLRESVAEARAATAAKFGNFRGSGSCGSSGIQPGQGVAGVG